MKQEMSGWYVCSAQHAVRVVLRIPLTPKPFFDIFWGGVCLVMCGYVAGALVSEKGMEKRTYMFTTVGTDDKVESPK